MIDENDRKTLKFKHFFSIFEKNSKVEDCHQQKPEHPSIDAKELMNSKGVCRVVLETVTRMKQKSLKVTLIRPL
jgi:hypothetical protein